MHTEDLIKLYILQKNHLANPNDPTKKLLFEAEYERLLPKTCFVSQDALAPPLFLDQPYIPFVLFKPTVTSLETPRPLIIHTHGGPHVYMSKDKLHAEIAYFLSKGYVVACPNYRGSTQYPNYLDIQLPPEQQLDSSIPRYEILNTWKIWESKSKDKHSIYGPEDVYAVTKYLQTMDFVDANYIFLRGGSFGSYINAHLLAGIRSGKFPPIFKGAHLSGGIKYPSASSLPDDIPLLITHSKPDDISPYATAAFFMEKLLLKSYSEKKETLVQTFVSEFGNHHLIAPDLELDDIEHPAYIELAQYITSTTTFIDTLAKGHAFPFTDALTQLNVLTGNMEETLKKIDYHQHVYSQEKMLTRSSPVITTPHCGPTMALLKLQLGSQFTGNIKRDLTSFFRFCFSPIHWESRKQLTIAGDEILNQPEFVAQLVEMIQAEESFLQANPGHMVMYHAADQSTMQVYCFISLWHTILKNGILNDDLPIINDMRLYPFMQQTFEDINVFLIKMRQRKSEVIPFNNAPGYQDRALACNPALTSNSHSTASCSLWWYFKANITGDPVRIEKILMDFFEILGIYSPERLERYMNLFSDRKIRSQGKTQALMQQLFIPQELAEKRAYMSQIWGEEFGPNSQGLSSPAIVQEIIARPEHFEETLVQNNRHAFSNHGNCPGFGETKLGFKYTGLFQIRYLPIEDQRNTTQSYFRSKDMHEAFVRDLAHLVREDYVDFILNDTTVPDFIAPGANDIKGAIKGPHASNFSEEAFFLQQKELYEGLVQNPNKEIYGEIIRLDRSQKNKIQARLKNEERLQDAQRLPLFALCRYLKGYTYYDLMLEAARSILIDNVTDERAKTFYKNDFDLLVSFLDNWSIPKAIDTQEMNSGLYHKLYQLMHNKMMHYKLDRSLHEFMYPPGPRPFDDYLWNLELSNAVNYVLLHAYLAKEKSYGQDISRGVARLYS